MASQNPIRLSPDEIDYIRKHHRSHTPLEIAEYIGCTKAAVYYHMHKLGLCPKITTGHFWTDKDSDKLIELYNSGMPYKDIAKALGVQIGRVTRRITYLRITGVIKSVRNNA